VVDTDMYKLGVEFPFQLLNTITEDIFVLEKGTPICQVIPFKRENWKSEAVPFDEKANKKNGFELKSKIVRSYKTQFWQKKTYL
jgi:DNA modification methylase